MSESMKDLFPDDSFNRKMQARLQELTPSIIEELYSRLKNDKSTNAGKILLAKSLSDAREPMPCLNIQPIQDKTDVPRWIAEVLSASANGQISPSQATKLISGATLYIKASKLVKWDLIAKKTGQPVI